jgi:ATP-binding cassette subfamily B protein
MQIGDIKKLLLQNRLFDSLPPSTIDAITKKFSIVSYQLGDTVIRAGESGEAFYIIADGKARMVSYTTDNKPITLAILTKEDSFGEQPLLSGHPSATTVRAGSNLTLLKMAAADFDWLVKKFPYFRKDLEAQVKQQSEFKFLRSLNFFSHLSLPETQKLLQIETIHLKSGEFLFHEDAVADAGYIIHTGSIRLIKESVENTTLAILNTGDICGEAALLHSSPQPTGAVATENTVVRRLSQAVFSQLTANPKVYDRIAQLAKNRSLQQQAILASRDTMHRVPQPAPTLQFKPTFRRLEGQVMVF